jgi:hypothetical protein
MSKTFRINEFHDTRDERRFPSAAFLTRDIGSIMTGTRRFFSSNIHARGKKRGKVHRLISGVTKATSDNETGITRSAMCSIIKDRAISTPSRSNSLSSTERFRICPTRPRSSPRSVRELVREGSAKWRIVIAGKPNGVVGFLP